METRRIAGALALAACLLAAWAGPAAARWVELTPGPEGADSAPYQFFPALPRGMHDTLYAYTEPDGHGFESYLRFELPEDLLGPDEEVARAYLTLYYAIDSFDGGPVDPDPGVLECRETLAAWSEATLTWSNKPAYGPPVDVVPDVDALGYVSCDVPELVADWAQGTRPNFGFALTSPTPRILGFYSFEAQVDPALKAALSIDVQPVPEPAAGAGAAVAALAAIARRRAAGRR